MIFQFVETSDSRSSTFDPPTFELRFRAKGERDRAVVEAHALGATPISWLTAAGLLWRQDVRIEPAGHRLYDVSVPYGQRNNQAGQWTFSFDTTGTVVRIKTARQHVATYDADGLVNSPADPHKGSIGVTGDGEVEGVDVVIPALRLIVEYKHPQGTVSIGYAKQLSRFTGSVNANPFLAGEFEAGELLFLGAAGSDGTHAEATVSYHFAASENVTDFSFASIANIAKQGHEYVWVEYEQIESDGQPGTAAKFAHVEKVYREVDFAGALGWS